MRPEFNTKTSKQTSEAELLFWFSKRKLIYLLPVADWECWGLISGGGGSVGGWAGLMDASPPSGESEQLGYRDNQLCLWMGWGGGGDISGLV